MILHILPGDAQVEDFKQTGITGEIAVARECLVDGPVNATSLDEFWHIRADFLGVSFAEYRERTVAEFQEIIDPPSGSEINLWFEHELFCQVNMWFCLWLLRHSDAAIYRVSPIVNSPSEVWKGFSDAKASELAKCFESRRKLTDEDVHLGASLWEAYRAGDYDRLRLLSNKQSDRLPYLDEVCRAAISQNTRPAELLSEIKNEGVTDFAEIYNAFRERAGVYGYGDSQVKRILENI